MSILITGMEMPKEGTVFVIDSAGQVWSNEWPTRGYIRLDGVTAVPVPAHGRLIDADALMDKKTWVVDAWSPSMSYRTEAVNVGDIMNAPTIIPVSEGDET